MYDWCIGSPTAVDSLTEMFCKILDDHFLTQTNPHITRPSAISASSGNTLDLVLTNHESLIEGTTVYPNGFDSDCFPVSFGMKKIFHRPVFQYDKADFHGLKIPFLTFRGTLLYLVRTLT